MGGGRVVPSIVKKGYCRGYAYKYLRKVYLCFASPE